MAEQPYAGLSVIFNKMTDKDQEIQILIRQRANLPMQYDSSNAMYNEMTDAIKEKCNEYADLCNDLAIKANATRKPSKYAALLNPPQDSSKMPNTYDDVIPPTPSSDDIPF